MKAIRVKHPFEPWNDGVYYQIGCDRIVNVFESRGLKVSRKDAYDMWAAFSDDNNETWADLEDRLRTDEQILACLQNYYEVIDDCLGETAWKLRQ